MMHEICCIISQFTTAFRCDIQETVTFQMIFNRGKDIYKYACKINCRCIFLCNLEIRKCALLKSFFTSFCFVVYKWFVFYKNRVDCLISKQCIHFMSFNNAESLERLLAIFKRNIKRILYQVIVHTALFAIYCISIVIKNKIIASYSLLSYM